MAGIGHRMYGVGRARGSLWSWRVERRLKLIDHMVPEEVLPPSLLSQLRVLGPIPGFVHINASRRT